MFKDKRAQSRNKRTTLVAHTSFLAFVRAVLDIWGLRTQCLVVEAKKKAIAAQLAELAREEAAKKAELERKMEVQHSLERPRVSP
eukprot:4505704-Amphidinium_carterae.1